MAQPKHPPGPPMDLANMRRQGVRRLVAYCLNDACRHQALIEVWSYPANTEMPIQAPGRLCEMRRSGQQNRRAPELERGTWLTGRLPLCRMVSECPAGASTISAAKASTSALSKHGTKRRPSRKP